jgi:uncharacterized protein (TIGR03435 family)
MRHVVYRCLAAILIVFPVAAQRPAFEAATVKPNSNCSGGRGGGGGGAPATGRLNVTCLAARDLIQIAYGMFADGMTQNPHRPQVLDGPGWIDSETFDIVAKAEDNAPVARMYGPMMQSLLEDRFALKIHKETRQLPVYTLTVAKNGAKLPATPEGSCTPLDLSHPAPAGALICGWGSVHMVKGNMVIDSHGSTVAKFAGSLVETVNRPVIDRTDLTGLFDIHLEFAPDNASSDATGAAIFTAIQDQLGLKLTAEKGPVEVLVIDHIERPSAN